MVLILDVSSGHGAHIWNKSDIAIVEGIWLHRQSSNPIFFGKDLFYSLFARHVPCTMILTISPMPGSYSNLGWTSWRGIFLRMSGWRWVGRMKCLQWTPHPPICLSALSHTIEFIYSPVMICYGSGDLVVGSAGWRELGDGGGPQDGVPAPHAEGRLLRLRQLYLHPAQIQIRISPPSRAQRWVHCRLAPCVQGQVVLRGAFCSIWGGSDPSYIVK